MKNFENRLKHVEDIIADLSKQQTINEKDRGIGEILQEMADNGDEEAKDLLEAYHRVIKLMVADVPEPIKAKFLDDYEAVQGNPEQIVRLLRHFLCHDCLKQSGTWYQAWNELLDAILDKIWETTRADDPEYKPGEPRRKLDLDHFWKFWGGDDHNHAGNVHAVA